ncbi:hypothetical protein EDC18_10340 [Natranaerovirga pectinivora]|uniref:Uncharacterized protein n=1 Tax=Natranaerovirga pectinivora TaxID=682400 RepID=A0A4R3MKU0_9FIRM|nr:hypothetical protein [Natranaerovirga pectinivora]TCT15336.1 hypothetical protein EDC18_10340 [Natranaerovirga pectinivora]
MLDNNKDYYLLKDIPDAFKRHSSLVETINSKRFQVNKNTSHSNNVKNQIINSNNNNETLLTLLLLLLFLDNNNANYNTQIF